MLLLLQIIIFIIKIIMDCHTLEIMSANAEGIETCQCNGVSQQPSIWHNLNHTPLHKTKCLSLCYLLLAKFPNASFLDVRNFLCIFVLECTITFHTPGKLFSLLLPAVLSHLHHPVETWNFIIIIIIISLTSIFFQDKSRVWTAASQQH